MLIPTYFISVKLILIHFEKKMFCVSFNTSNSMKKFARLNDKNNFNPFKVKNKNKLLLQELN